MEIPASLQEVWPSFVLEPALGPSNQGSLEKASLAMVVWKLSSSPRNLGPCTVQSQGTDCGKGRRHVLFHLLGSSLVQQNETNTQAFKSYLHAMALSLLASTTHRALQGSVPALEDTVAQGGLR